MLHVRFLRNLLESTAKTKEERLLFCLNQHRRWELREKGGGGGIKPAVQVLVLWLHKSKAETHVQQGSVLDPDETGPGYSQPGFSHQAAARVCFYISPSHHNSRWKSTFTGNTIMSFLRKRVQATNYIWILRLSEMVNKGLRNAWWKVYQIPTWASAPEETSIFMALEKARPVTIPEWPLSLLLTCMNQQPCLDVSSK